MSALTEARESVVAELEDLFPNRRVYGWVPPSPVIPCVIVSPDETQLEVAGHQRWNYRLRITAIAAAQDTSPDAVAALEDDVELLLSWAGPIAYDVNIGPAVYGGTTVLAVGLSIPYPVNIPTL